MRDYLLIIQVLLGAFILVSGLRFLFKKHRLKTLTERQDRIHHAKLKLLDLYRLSNDAFRIPEQSIQMAENKDPSFEAVLQLQISVLTQYRNTIDGTLKEMREDIREKLRLANVPSLLESYRKFEQIYPELERLHDEFSKQLEGECSSESVWEMYRAMPKTFSDPDYNFTKDASDVFFDLQTQLTDEVLLLHLKLIENGAPKLSMKVQKKKS